MSKKYFLGAFTIIFITILFIIYKNATNTSNSNFLKNSDSVSVDLKVNGSDGPIDVYDSDQSKPLHISWNSKNAIFCPQYSEVENLLTYEYGKTSGSESYPGYILHSGVLSIACIDGKGHFAKDKVEVHLIPDPKAEPFKIISPSSDSIVKKGSIFNIRWSGYDKRFSQNSKYTVVLLKNGKNYGIYISEAFSVLQNNIKWEVPAPGSGWQSESLYPDSNYQLAFYFNDYLIATSSYFSVTDPSISNAKVDLKINGSNGPIVISKDGSLEASWVSSGVDACIAFQDDHLFESGVESNGGWSSMDSTHPSFPKGYSTVFTIKCKKKFGIQFSSESISDSVTVILK